MTKVKNKKQKNFECVKCGDVREKRRGIEAHIARLHRDCKPVSDFYKLTTKPMPVKAKADYERNKAYYGNKKTKRAYKKREQKGLSPTLTMNVGGGTGFVDIPTTIRVYIAIGGV